MTTPLLLRGVDLAAFAVALVGRMHSGGVAVPAGGAGEFVRAMGELAPRTTDELYWAARLTLVNRESDLDAFDVVFAAVFADAVAGLDPPSLARRSSEPVVPADAARAGHGPPLDVDGLPWITRPSAVTARDASDDGVQLPDLLPSRIVARADEPFDRFDPEDLRLLGRWLDQAGADWPQRSTLRRERHHRGDRIDLRQTVRDSRRTGWETVVLARTRRRRRPRRIVLVCDVSRSMQPYATVYLHLMRAAMLRRTTVRPEVFAFSTTLTRLTAVLAHRSPEVALARVNATVVDRYGGTHLGRSLAALLAGPHGAALRGAVVVLASDGWDSDPPEVLDHALVRMRRRAHRIIWLNPRAAQPGFQPLAGSMAAALPHCDAFLPAHSLQGLRELFSVLAER
ncbi:MULTISPECIES: VWA domain-containing protein [Mycobacteriaceae]|uniref:vWA domain-containing protein n=1 Tax=Mycobacteriaceae TaxID=1762 RepID=UPI0007FF5283|nr:MULTISPECIES: VWA domain-containing protein [Mycobacteriaceae]MCK0175570.1 VWA domain-containing protein [Mycolicibacterium sp. F2034L]OBB61490.1 VWA containing CoxE family protein [Mycobacterium sp. 852013-51886_SCH5428379]